MIRDFTKSRNASKISRLDSKTLDKCVSHVNMVFARLIEIEFDRKFLKTYYEFMYGNAHRKNRIHWRVALQISNGDYKGIEDLLRQEVIIETISYDDGKFPALVFVLPDADINFIPVYLAVVFHLGCWTAGVSKKEKPFRFFVFEQEKKGCTLHHWDTKNDKEIQCDGLYEKSVQSFIDAIESELASLPVKENGGEIEDLTFKTSMDDEIDELGEAHEIFPEESCGEIVHFKLKGEEKKQIVTELKGMFENLENRKTNKGLLLKHLAYELLLERFNSNPFKYLQMFTQQELRNNLFREMYDSACIHLGEDFIKPYAGQFQFKRFIGFRGESILVFIPPTIIGFTEIRFIAFVYGESVCYDEVLDEETVDFRFFSLEERINGCHLIEICDNKRIEHGDNYKADLNDFLYCIQHLVNSEILWPP